MRASIARFTSASLFVVLAFACSDSDDAGSSSRNDGGPGNDGSTTSSGGQQPGNPDGSGGPDGSGDATPPPPETFVNVTTETVEYGGVTRTYLLAKPKNYDANTSYPLVLSFHGNPSNAAIQAGGLPFDSVSKTAAVIAYPQALLADESGFSNWDLYTPTDTNADMNWIRGLPAHIATTVNIDTSKVFGFGYSGGAFFLSQFTCRIGDVFKAVSINAGGAPYEAEMGYGQFGNGCYQCPAAAVATIITHGQVDDQVEPASGEYAKTCRATYNGCGDTLSASTPEPCQIVDGCPADKPVKFCFIPGQGHGPWAQAMTSAWAFFLAAP